jgi:hypothetical protein
VRAGDSEEHGVEHHRIDPLEGAADEPNQPARLGLFDDGEQRTRGVVFPRKHQPVDSRPAGIEDVVPSLEAHRHVSDEGEPWKLLLQGADALEVWRPVREKVDDRYPDGLPITHPGQRWPIDALAQLVPVTNGRTEPLHVQRMW